ncbi:MAG: ABC transporter permease [Gemmatales bacterium]|nr:ABC transporter permease [Gemmatales bacterium]MCS7161438.1 ABC transporter permease [Gemmatales bacterium]MDW8176641.1 ABC transporter permease [Gemmatales bacterium]MDW8223272.1 ABC transporter permease [Gemmatales bacterium]
MKKLLGLFLFFLALYLTLYLAPETTPNLAFHYNLGRDIGYYGILTLGAGILIISGGIDLSIGSVVGLAATLFPMLLLAYGESHPLNPVWAIGLILLLGAAIGWTHGILITKLKLQPFVVTLCGLFIYRGLARWISGEQVQGLGNQFSSLKDLLYTQPLGPLPKFLVIFLTLVVLLGMFLHGTVYGRYLYAIGGNERAARYAGISVDRYKILAYIICSTLAAFAGILFIMQHNSALPSNTGSFYELYAIAAAVLGGCSLRGGEGTIVGMVLGTAIIWLLDRLTLMLGIRSELLPTVVGAFLLAGAILEAVLQRWQGGSHQD